VLHKIFTRCDRKAKDPAVKKDPTKKDDVAERGRAAVVRVHQDPPALVQLRQSHRAAAAFRASTPVRRVAAASAEVAITPDSFEGVFAGGSEVPAGDSCRGPVAPPRAPVPQPRRALPQAPPEQRTPNTTQRDRSAPRNLSQGSRLPPRLEQLTATQLRQLNQFASQNLSQGSRLPPRLEQPTPSTTQLNRSAPKVVGGGSRLGSKTGQQPRKQTSRRAMPQPQAAPPALP
jgi:hypothetical protein